MHYFEPVSADHPDHDPAYPASLQALTIPSHGSAMLARFFIASGAGPHPTVILLHGFPGTELNFDLAHAIRRSGWNILVFHYRGSWGSPGSFSLKHAAEDVHSAIHFLRSELASNYRCDAKKIVLLGHSMGGSLALQTAAKDKRICAAATIAAFDFAAFAEWMSANPERSLFAIETFAKNFGPIQGITPSEFVEEIQNHQKQMGLPQLAASLKNIPLLLCFGDRDEVSIPATHHVPLMQAIQELNPVSLQEIPFPADHMLSQTRVSLARCLVEWLDRLRLN